MLSSRMFWLSTAMLAITCASAQANESRWPKWYVGLHGSVPFMDDYTLSSGSSTVGSWKFDSGWGVGASIGYMPTIGNEKSILWEAIRLEFEYHQQQNDFDQFNFTSGGTLPLSGNTNVSAYMGNIFYDAKTQSSLTPYIGVGAGWASVKFEDDVSSDSDSVMAYQIMSGVYYEPELMPLTRLLVGIRYFDTVDPEYVSSTSTFKFDYSSINLEAGAQFRF